MELEQSTAGLSNVSDTWKSSAPTIESYLEHGVVPSSAFRGKHETSPFTPEPVALLNSAYRFYIQSMSKLLSHIENADARSITDRIRWTKGLNVDSQSNRGRTSHQGRAE